MWCGWLPLRGIGEVVSLGESGGLGGGDVGDFDDLGMSGDFDDLGAFGKLGMSIDLGDVYAFGDPGEVSDLLYIYHLVIYIPSCFEPLGSAATQIEVIQCVTYGRVFLWCWM